MTDKHKEFQDGMSNYEYERLVKFDNDIWNAAIEAVAEQSEYRLMYPDEIRKLKK